MRRTGALPALALLASLLSIAPAHAALFERVEPQAERARVAPAVARVRIQPGDVAMLRAARGGRAELPLADGGSLPLVLEAASPFSPDARLVTRDELGEHPNPTRVDAYRVHVEGDPTSWGFVTFVEGRAMGSVSARGTRFGIQPEAAGGAHAVTDESQQPIESRPFECGTEEDAVSSDSRRAEHLRAQSTLATRPSPYRLECLLFLDGDYELYANKFGSDLSACTQYLTTLIGTVSAIYERDLNITITVNLLTIWTTSSDPWVGTNTEQRLNDYTGWHALNRLGEIRTLAHLVSGASLGGGRAWFDGLCNVQRGYGVSQLDAFYTFPTSSTTWDVMVVAHEIGHNFGSRHTHSCFWQDNNLAAPGALLDSCFTAEDACYSGPTGPAYITPGRGTIMSYCHQGAYGMGGIRLDFHPSCISWMRAYAQSGCLAFDVPQPPRALLAGPAPAGGIVLDWIAPPNTPGIIGYDVYRHTVQFDINPTLLGTTAGTSFEDAVGTLGTFYKVRTVRASDSSALTGQATAKPCAPGRVTTYDAGSSAVDIVPRDFNLDGVPDAAIADSAGSRVTLLRGQRCSLCESDYSIPVHHTLDFAPRTLAIGDLDHDGLPDLIAAGGSGSQLAVLRNVGGGNMTFAPVVGISAPRPIASLVAQDFDEDGWIDVAFVDGATDTVWTLRGADPGGPGATFGAFDAHFAGGPARCLATGDLDGDGVPDLVVASTAAIHTLLGIGVAGDGTGAFATPISTPIALDAEHVSVGDIDRDRVLDMVAAASTGAVTGIGDGLGSFINLQSIVSTNVVNGTLADVTRDGALDVVLGTWDQGTLRVVPGMGDGTWQTPVTHVVQGAPGYRSMAIVDHDADQRPGVYLGRTDGKLQMIHMACAGAVSGTLDVLEPTLPATWVTGEDRAIRWTRGSGVMAAEVQISYDNGATWLTVAPAVWDTTYNWTVVGSYTEEARVRVRDAFIPSRIALDDGPFMIVPQEDVAVPPTALPATLKLAIDGAHPARGTLGVRLALPAGGRAMLELLDIAGRRVQALDLGELPAGEHHRAFTGALRPGVYLVRATHGGRHVVARAVVVE